MAVATTSARRRGLTAPRRRMTAALRRLTATKSRRALVVVAALVFAWPPLAWGAARWLAAGAGQGQSSRADAIVVLAGSSTYVERARRAAALYAEGRAPRVVLTNDNLKGGWSEAEQRNPLFVERAAAELRRGGVPDERIEIIHQPVTSTYEEAARVGEYAAERRWRSLVVVTSAYHARRARWTFRRALGPGGVAVTLEGVAPGEQSPPAATWWLSRLGWRMVAGEYLKLIYYRLAYA
jgi:uncharacterized SAM-binding protein YcdF (DUF218 family)